MTLSLDKLSAVLTDRGKTHGDFPVQSTICFNLKATMRLGPHALSAPHQEALEMIAVKISRILCGNPDEIDHWLDIAGYAKLVSDMLEKKSDK